MIKNRSNFYTLLIISILATACGQSKIATAQPNVSKKSQSLFEKGLQQQRYGEYDNAIDLFNQAIKKSPSYLDAYDALANTYYKRKLLPEAINTYKRLLALQPDHYYGLYELGKIYFSMDNMDSAEYYYRAFLKVNNTNDKNSKKAQLALRNISFGREARANPVDITPINMGSNINTKGQEYSPAFSIDEKTLYITRHTGNITGNRPNEDIYYSVYDDNKWEEIKNLGSPINTIENEGAFSISADGYYLFFTSCSRPGGQGQCDIWLSIDKSGQWSEPMNLQKPVNSKYWESQPSIASNGKVLYFTSDRPGGYGGTDIWMARFGDSGWEKPTNLGPEVNTSLDEQFPFIHSDNYTLYFSSEGHPGMGKSDIFVTHIKPDGEWETPLNLGYPINSTGNDWNLIVSRDGATAYYSSDNIKESKGGLDIYSFQLPPKLQAQRVSYVRGFVKDADTKKPLNANILLTPLNGGETTSTYSDSKKGQFVVPLRADIRYSLTIDKKGYLFHSEYFDMPNVASDKPFERTINLQKLEIGKSVVLNNIFFDTDKFDLKEESSAGLIKLEEFLTTNKELSIEISGHTDNLGSASHNKTLSENRAKKVYEYLISKGIVSSRLKYIGYGSTMPIESNATKEGQAKNRRTEFKIID